MQDDLYKRTGRCPTSRFPDQKLQGRLSSTETSGIITGGVRYRTEVHYHFFHSLKHLFVKFGTVVNLTRRA
jgi:hypothetical protein